jgi:hypothetical protein
MQGGMNFSRALARRVRRRRGPKITRPNWSARLALPLARRHYLPAQAIAHYERLRTRVSDPNGWESDARAREDCVSSRASSAVAPGGVPRLL